MPLLATSLMHHDTREYGILLSALGAGDLAGALAVTSVNRLFGRRRAMFADLLGTAAMVAAPVITTNLWVVAGGAFFGGVGGILWIPNSRTISQRLVPAAVFGRYNAAARLFNWDAMPLGAGLVGVLAQWFGMRVAFAVFAFAAVLTIVPFLRTVTPAHSRRPTRLPYTTDARGPRHSGGPREPSFRAPRKPYRLAVEHLPTTAPPARFGSCLLLPCRMPSAGRVTCCRSGRCCPVGRCGPRPTSDRRGVAAVQHTPRTRPIVNPHQKRGRGCPAMSVHVGALATAGLGVDAAQAGVYRPVRRPASLIDNVPRHEHSCERPLGPSGTVICVPSLERIE